MAPAVDLSKLHFKADGNPVLSQSYTLQLVGDWGGANFHRICSWLTQEFCDRAGSQSRTAIWSLRDGGMDSLLQVEEGQAHLAIATPAALMSRSSGGEPPFPRPLSRLRALAVLPQDDSMVLAVDAKYNIKTFDDLRRTKPALRIATSVNDGTNFIGFVASRYMQAHGISPSELESWGGKYVTAVRPEQTVALVESGEADALLQEAIMTPWWRDLVSRNRIMPLPAEREALQELQKSINMKERTIRAGFWDDLENELPTLDFSDFVIFVRDDLPDEVAYLLTWCLVETRSLIEGQYQHLPREWSPLTYPLQPKKMCQTPITLHPGAKEYYIRAGHL
jgi:uncharacterized protein